MLNFFDISIFWIQCCHIGTASCYLVYFRLSLVIEMSKWCCAVALYWFLGDELCYQNGDLFGDVYVFQK
jgi:hypothetical protein